MFPCYHWIDDGDEVSLTSKTSKFYVVYLSCGREIRKKCWRNSHSIENEIKFTEGGGGGGGGPNCRNPIIHRVVELIGEDYESAFKSKIRH